VTATVIAETVFLVLDYAIKVIAVGVVPENRRPSSSTAWLLLILMLPVVGLPLFLLLGSPYVHGRRHAIQAMANSRLDDGLAHLPSAPPGVPLPDGLTTLVKLNRRLTSLPMLTGTNLGLSDDYQRSLDELTAQIGRARRYVHMEIYIVAWDRTTEPVLDALADAVARGVTVRLLLDHIGSRAYPGYRRLKRRLTADGIDWHLMLPINPFRGQIRRFDLRNHRKLVVIDGEIGYMGSQNLIDATYLKPANKKVGRRWNEVTIMLRGDIVAALEAVFAVDWFTESGEVIAPEFPSLEHTHIGGADNAFQLVPSGPGFVTEPNLRLFTALIHRAQSRLSIASPYFVPDESLLAAITTAAYRGVRVELFVSEQSDQFMVGHAQASYYRVLLEAGIEIYLYPKPAVLHAKFFTVDDEVAVIGSSNMDMRSFGLNYEISLMGTGGDLVEGLQTIVQRYKQVSRRLTQEEWRARPLRLRYIDNAMRLTSALQ
jgi:cardiolipin synthase